VHGLGLDAERCTFARMDIELCAIEEGFCRYTADIEAGSAHLGFFDEGDLQFLRGEAFGGQVPAGSSSYDDGIVFHGLPLFSHTSLFLYEHRDVDIRDKIAKIFEKTSRIGPVDDSVIRGEGETDPHFEGGNGCMGHNAFGGRPRDNGIYA